MYWAEYVEQKPVDRLYGENGFKTAADAGHITRDVGGCNRDFVSSATQQRQKAGLLKFYLSVSAFLNNFKNFANLHQYISRSEHYVYKNKVFAVDMNLIRY
jgi:hypothetical protein